MHSRTTLRSRTSVRVAMVALATCFCATACGSSDAGGNANGNTDVATGGKLFQHRRHGNSEARQRLPRQASSLAPSPMPWVRPPSRPSRPASSSSTAVNSTRFSRSGSPRSASPARKAPPVSRRTWRTSWSVSPTSHDQQPQPRGDHRTAARSDPRQQAAPGQALPATRGNRSDGLQHPPRLSVEGELPPCR